jgi:hypothetical protein
VESQLLLFHQVKDKYLNRSVGAAATAAPAPALPAAALPSDTAHAALPPHTIKLPIASRFPSSSSNTAAPLATSSSSSSSSALPSPRAIHASTVNYASAAAYVNSRFSLVSTLHTLHLGVANSTERLMQQNAPSTPATAAYLPSPSASAAAAVPSPTSVPLTSLPISQRVQLAQQLHKHCESDVVKRNKPLPFDSELGFGSEAHNAAALPHAAAALLDSSYVHNHVTQRFNAFTRSQQVSSQRPHHSAQVRASIVMRENQPPPQIWPLDSEAPSPHHPQLFSAASTSAYRSIADSVPSFSSSSPHTASSCPARATISSILSMGSSTLPSIVTANESLNRIRLLHARGMARCATVRDEVKERQAVWAARQSLIRQSVGMARTWSEEKEAEREVEEEVALLEQTEAAQRALLFATSQHRYAQHQAALRAEAMAREVGVRFTAEQWAAAGVDTDHPKVQAVLLRQSAVVAQQAGTRTATIRPHPALYVRGEVVPAVMVSPSAAGTPLIRGSTGGGSGEADDSTTNSSVGAPSLMLERRYSNVSQLSSGEVTPQQQQIAIHLSLDAEGGGGGIAPHPFQLAFGNDDTERTNLTALSDLVPLIPLSDRSGVSTQPLLSHRSGLDSSTGKSGGGGGGGGADYLMLPISQSTHHSNSSTANSMHTSSLVPLLSMTNTNSMNTTGRLGSSGVGGGGGGGATSSLSSDELSQSSTLSTSTVFSHSTASPDSFHDDDDATADSNSTTLRTMELLSPLPDPSASSFPPSRPSTALHSFDDGAPFSPLSSIASPFAATSGHHPHHHHHSAVHHDTFDPIVQQVASRHRPPPHTHLVGNVLTASLHLLYINSA